MLRILVMVQKLCAVFNIIEGTIHLGCNGQSALHRAFSDSPISPDEPQNDLLSVLHHHRCKSPLLWKTRYIVEGCQDDTRNLDQLDTWAMLNI